MKPIPLVDLKAQYETIEKEVDAAIKNVLESTDFILGQQVEKFEDKFSAYCGTKYAIGVASGTDALELGMRATGIKEGDDVITPTNSFIASSSAISQTGAKPVLVDVEKNSFNIDPTKIEEKLTKRTRAIMPVHLYGRPADMGAITQIAKKYNLMVFEDACQAHGAEIQIQSSKFKVQSWKKVGSIGLFGAFSFYPSKNLGAYGDGGIVTTQSKKLRDKVIQMRNYGQTKKYHHDYLAQNSRLDTVQAAILLVKLQYLDKWNKKRLLIAKNYNKLFQNLPVITPIIPDGSEHVFSLYVIRTEKRDKLANYLRKNGIATGVHYPIPIHLQKAYRDLGYKKGDFPVSERLSEEILSLPLYPELTESQIEFISKTIKKFYKFQANFSNLTSKEKSVSPTSTSLLSA